MKTMREINAWAKANDAEFFGEKWDWYSLSFANGKTYKDFYGNLHPEKDEISFSDSGDPFCCAIPEFGSFDGLSLGSEMWEVLLSSYLRKSKHQFFRTSTTSQPKFKNLNAALAACGFKIIRKLKSNHGRYKVFVWEREKV